MTDILLMIVAIAVLSAIFIYRDKLKIQKRKEVNDQIKDFVYYNSRTDTLRISKRDSNLAEVLEIIPYRRTEYGETPEKLTYTWATVGGVTTGGFHKSGGFFARDRGNSGKVKLVYYQASGNKMLPYDVKKIELSGELAEEARKSAVKEYLEGNAFIIMGEVANMDAAGAAIQLGHRDVAFNIIESAKIAASSTYEKCSAIVNWLAKAEPAVKQQPKPMSKAERKAAEEKAKKSRKRTVIIVSVAAVAVVLCIVAGIMIAGRMEKAAQLENYNRAVALLEAKEYDLAITAFEVMGDYENAAEMVMEAKYQKAHSYMKPANYSTAAMLFQELGDYKDSREQHRLANDAYELDSLQYSYNLALEKADQGDYEYACEILYKLGDFSDSRQQLEAVADRWYQEMVEQINETVEAGAIWADANGFRDIIEATGGHEKAQMAYDYFGNGSAGGDPIYRHVKIACVEGNLQEAKALMDACDLMELKPFQTLYDTVSRFSPYCGDFVHTGGDQSILTNTTDEPVNVVHASVKLKITGDDILLTDYQLWINNNDNRYGQYHFGAFDADLAHFFRGVSKQQDFTATLDENGDLVFWAYPAGNLEQPQGSVTYTRGVS